ncbi:hypothetical protein C5167_034533 [Papaver somniferum]|uniref:Uncharacterized protein n=1 Tax=Papaver somniferum TaxID=3469 RepID=A0A4Y7KD72_PAPSO|nr:hypothetical protein C5167_034533 [Papaver somniferum]
MTSSPSVSCFDVNCVLRIDGSFCLHHQPYCLCCAIVDHLTIYTLELSPQIEVNASSVPKEGYDGANGVLDEAVLLVTVVLA